MGFDGIKHTFGKTAATLWAADQNMRKKAIFARNNPSRAAGNVALTAAKTTVAVPTQAAKAITSHLNKAVVEPAIWVTKGAITKSQGAYSDVKTRRTLSDARVMQRWVVASQNAGEAPKVEQELVDQLRYGLIGALAKANALTRTQKTIKVNWHAYASHAGQVVTTQNAKAALAAAAVRPLADPRIAVKPLLSAASEERLLDAVGLNTSDSLDAGVLAAHRSGFVKTLRNTNLWHKDVEIHQYQKEQIAVRKDLLVLEGALKAINSLKNEGPIAPEDTAKAAKIRAGSVRKIQNGLLAAQRLQTDIAGNQLSNRFVGLPFDTKALSAQADSLLQRHSLTASAHALDFKGLSKLALPAEAETSKAPSTPRQLVPQALSRYMLRQKLQAQLVTNQRAETRYQAELDQLRSFTLDETASINPALQLQHVDNKRALAKATGRLAAARLRALDATAHPQKGPARIAALEVRVSQLTEEINGFRAYAAHPATTASNADWRLIAPRYAAEANLLAKQITNINKKILSINIGLRQVTDDAQHQNLELRKKKLTSKLDIAMNKQDQIGLDLALAKLQGRYVPNEDSAAHLLMNEFKDLDVIQNRREYAVRAGFITIQSGLSQLLADKQQRSSPYVRADAMPLQGAPSVVNNILKGAWYSVAVVPLVNLPYWGAVRAHAAWSNYRFVQAVQLATQER